MAKSQSMRTPLGKVRGLGSAKSGTEHFWRQRVTAAANLILTAVFVVVVIALQAGTYADVRAALANPVLNVLTIGMVVSIVWHMKIGMQVIVEDYVHTDNLKILALVANTFFCGLVGLASVVALVKIGFGA
ncbi:succinate dehydrogenase, hydrophobic membrane anchor protein [Oharaeibacter diazotrophicus]|uniref:Succinate dehydrogenase hydrophobic membrane anchor subunit n=1 Tax=Oharaeibacter diazotrophicus TaxID=1920512 RepID=A0A4R6R7X3_9HYPH|nr:succinate dehydrogenase, hydrophobic membrane anchor protein [Oharaeibacter diazotrophicus]TDP81944.1 succinate dehydrogenase / fumarate reductase membrane anchor subunit [Oharaeibacter diazotrophicus]BBE73576.1 succinate dehydrogenase [Pleomorphomonas sp. SM30]GLS75366.1 succinate dehydrogenase, hydrophobic membrane anchor protein [Oharaeibacter diazotrophicus]